MAIKKKQIEKDLTVKLWIDSKKDLKKIIRSKLEIKI
jgi:hypothetical protein